MKVLIIGASQKEERYANMAMKRLEEEGHDVILFNPAIQDIEGRPVVNNLCDIHEPIDSVTLYVGPKNLEPLISQIIALKPARVISNPGTETEAMKEACTKAGITYIEACTLVMLRTKQF